MKEYPIYNAGSAFIDPYLCTTLEGFPELWNAFLLKQGIITESEGVSLGTFLYFSGIEQTFWDKRAKEVRQIVLKNYPKGEHKTMTVEFLESVIEHVCGYKFEN